MKNKKINKIFASLISLGILTIPVFCPTKVVASKILNEKVETGNKFKSLVNDAGMQFLEFVKEKQDDLQKEYIDLPNSFNATQTTFWQPWDDDWHTCRTPENGAGNFSTNINISTNFKSINDKNQLDITDPTELSFSNLKLIQNRPKQDFVGKVSEMFDDVHLNDIENPTMYATAWHWDWSNGGFDCFLNKIKNGYQYNWNKVFTTNENEFNWNLNQNLFSQTKTFNTFASIQHSISELLEKKKVKKKYHLPDILLGKYFVSFDDLQFNSTDIDFYRQWCSIFEMGKRHSDFSKEQMRKIINFLLPRAETTNKIISGSCFTPITTYSNDFKPLTPDGHIENHEAHYKNGYFNYEINNVSKFFNINLIKDTFKYDEDYWCYTSGSPSWAPDAGLYINPSIIDWNTSNSWANNFFPYYFVLGTDEHWRCNPAFYYAQTNWTTTLQFNDVPFAKQLTYDPNLLYQIKNIGYDTKKQQYFTQSGINDELMLGLMSTYYQNNDFLGANRFLNAQHKLKELEGWNERNPETHKIDKPNENTKLMTSGTFYYDKINGMNTDIIGGIDQWFPIGVIYDKDGKPTGQNGLSAEVYGNYGDFVKNPMFVALKEIINSFLADKELDYSNYFKVREWCKNYCIKNHDLPVSWNEQEQKYESEELKEAFRNELLADDWRENCQKYGINEDSIQDLKDLATFARGINFNQWDMVSEDGSSWTNTDQNQFVRDEQTNQDFAHFHKMIDPEQSNWTSGITDYFDLSNSNSDSFHLITNAVGLVSDLSKKLSNTDFVGETGIKSIYEKHNYSDTDTSYEFGNSNNLNSLKNRYGNIINQTTEKFINKHGSHTTTGWEIKKEGEIIVSAFDDSIWAKAENKPNVMVRAYADELGKDFYDENTVNPIFNKIEYEKNKYNMNNQPYLLKSPKDVIAIAQKRASASSNDGNLSLNVLKEIFYDYKNNKKALPFIKANLLNLNEISYDLPSDRISVDVNNEEGDIEIKLWKPKADKKHDKPEVIKINNFEKGCEPFVPDVGLKSASIALIVSGIVGSLLVIAGIWYLHRYKNRKTSRLTKEARKYRKIKGED